MFQKDLHLECTGWIQGWYILTNDKNEVEAEAQRKSEPFDKDNVLCWLKLNSKVKRNAYIIDSVNEFEMSVHFIGFNCSVTKCRSWYENSCFIFF